MLSMTGALLVGLVSLLGDLPLIAYPTILQTLL